MFRLLRLFSVEVNDFKSINEGYTYVEMVHMADVGDQYCVIGRSDLVAIETRSGSLIDSIRFHFDDCE